MTHNIINGMQNSGALSGEEVWRQSMSTVFPVGETIGQGVILGSKEFIEDHILA